MATGSSKAARSGSLQKLKITAYEDPGFTQIASTRPNTLRVMINPTGYATSMGATYTREAAAGSRGTAVAFNRELPRSIELSLVFDGTGTVPDAPDKSVPDQIEDLKRLALDINGRIHSPNFVAISWGTLLFKGRLKRLDIQYTLFAPDGTPLRAKVKATFVEYQKSSESSVAKNNQSPDLTHAITVTAGDTLPNLCDRVYGDSRYYLAVARHNELDDFRRLVPGDMLMFPPLSGELP